MTLAAWLALALVPILPILGLLTALLERSGPIRLRHWAEESGGRLRDLYEDRRSFGIFRYVLNLGAKMAPLVLGALVARGLVDHGVRHPYLIAVVAVLVLLALAEVANRDLLRRDPEEALRVLTGLYRFTGWILTPVIFLFRPLVPAEIEAFIDVGTREGILEPADRDLLWGVVDFGDTQLRSVMTPRVDLVAGEVDEPLEALLDRMIEAPVTRMPLYRESIDQVVGVLHLRDLVVGMRRSPRPKALELAKPALLVPETKHLAQMLREFQAQRQQLAIVLNEHGGTEGLVTIEDLIEEIVGEIQDEHDVAEPENRLLADGSLLLDGRAEIETLDEFFGWKPEEETVETVGGLVSGLVGYVPADGEVIEHDRLRFEIERADERRILSLRVRRLDEAEGDGAA